MPNIKDLCNDKLTEIETYLLSLNQEAFYNRLIGLFQKCPEGNIKTEFASQSITDILSREFWIERYAKDFPNFNYVYILALQSDLPLLYTRLSIEGLYKYQKMTNVVINNNKYNLGELQEKVFGLSSPYYISNLSEDIINKVLSADKNCGCFILRVTTTQPWYNGDFIQFVMTIRLNTDDTYKIDKLLLQMYYPSNDTRVVIKELREERLNGRELTERIGNNGTEAMNKFLQTKYNHSNDRTLLILRSLILLGKIQYNPFPVNVETYNNIQKMVYY